MSGVRAGAATDAPGSDGPWPSGYRTVLLARLLLSGYFFVPYIALYARQLNIALGLLLVIEAVFALLTVLFDLPAGHLADRIGPRQALLLGCGLEGSAALLLGVLPHASVFWAVQPLFAASQALTMGADAALAAGLLRRAGAFERFEHGERLYQSLALATTGAVLVTSSALSLVALQATFVATAAAQFAAGAVLLRVTDVRADSSDGVRITLTARARGLAHGIRTAPGLRTDLLAIVLTGSAFSVLLYLTPLYLVAAGTGVHRIGLAAAVVALLAAALSAVVSSEWPARVLVGLAVVGAGGLHVGFAVVTLLAAVVVQTAQAHLLPRFRSRVLSDLHGHGDATALSIVTTGRNLGFAVLAPFLGLLTALLGLGGLCLLCAVLFLLGGLAMTTGMSLGRVPATQTRLS